MPVALANINGLDGVLQDRALIVFLEKSFNKIKSSRIEDFDRRLKSLKEELVTGMTGMTGVTHFTDIINGWNDYLDAKNDSFDTLKTPSHVSQVSHVSQNLAFYDKIYEANITGRSLEIAFPLLITASFLEEVLFNSTLNLFSSIAKRRRESEMDDSHVIILRFVASLASSLQMAYTPSDLFKRFQEEFSGVDLGLNVVSFSMALNRLQLIKKRERTGVKRLIFLDFNKAKTRIGLFDVEAFLGLCEVKKEEQVSYNTNEDEVLKEAFDGVS